MFSRKTKRFLSRIAVCLLALVCIGTGYFLISEKRETNSKNLIDVKDEAYAAVTTNTAVGLNFKVYDNGRIAVTGTATDDYDFVITTVTLEAGTYTVGGCKSNIGKYGIKATAGSDVYYAGTDGETGATFTLESETEVTISIFVKKDAVCYKEFRPTLAAGDEAISFYK